MKRKENIMYGYGGEMNPLQWLAVTGDVTSLTDTDKQTLGLTVQANANQTPSSTVQLQHRVHPVDD